MKKELLLTTVNYLVCYTLPVLILNILLYISTQSDLLYHLPEITIVIILFSFIFQVLIVVWFWRSSKIAMQFKYLFLFITMILVVVIGFFSLVNILRGFAS